jgi:uncharacterized protein involved in response to NO
MTFAVGTMVIFSHGGLSQELKKPHWSLTLIGILTGTALILRIVAVYHPEHYFILLAASSSVWLIAALVWLCRVIPVVLRSIPAEEFERCHEEARERVANLRNRQGR